MHIKSKGVSLFELVIVMGIFAIISIGVTNLSIKAIESNQSQMTLSYQDHIYASVQDDLRRDVRSAYAIWVSNNGAGPGATQSYYVQQACAGASPNVAAENPNRSGNTLNIIKQLSYTPGTPPTISFECIRYQFVTEGGTDYLVRLETTPPVQNVEPGDLWPKDTAGASTDICNMPVFGSVVTTTAPNKVYNATATSTEDHDFSGLFAISYGDELTPSPTSPTTNCTFFVNTVSLYNYSMVAKGYSNKYDVKFGKANLSAPRLTYDINTSLKFF